MTRPAGQACDSWDNSGCVGTEYCPPRCPRFIDSTGEPLLVRPFEAGDVSALVAMYEALDAESGTMGLPPTGPEAVESWLARLTETGWNLVALDAGRAVGHVGVAPAGADDPEFVIFVHQDYQGRGLGTELVRQTVAYAADEGYDALSLSVSKGNRRAIHVYRTVGFQPEGEVLGPEVAVEMRLPLTTPIADPVRLPPAPR
jgi:RimJ/RimL family protein N-acetyltransferase